VGLTLRAVAASRHAAERKRAVETRGVGGAADVNKRPRCLDVPHVDASVAWAEWAARSSGTADVRTRPRADDPIEIVGHTI
jgi:hypothetical protein